jgi:hypothetical protein
MRKKISINVDNKFNWKIDNIFVCYWSINLHGVVGLERRTGEIDRDLEHLIAATGDAGLDLMRICVASSLWSAKTELVFLNSLISSFNKSTCFS